MTILFVHGAGHAAWCWREHFTGWFEVRGYTVAAPDLPRITDSASHITSGVQSLLLGAARPHAMLLHRS